MIRPVREESSRPPGEESLVAAIISEGLKMDGPDYATMPCCRYWAAIVGLDPESLYEMAAKATAHADIPYKRRDGCRHRETARGDFKCIHKIEIDRADFEQRKRGMICAYCLFRKAKHRNRVLPENLHMDYPGWRQEAIPTCPECYVAIEAGAKYVPEGYPRLKELRRVTNENWVEWEGQEVKA